MYVRGKGINGLLLLTVMVAFLPVQVFAQMAHEVGEQFSQRVWQARDGLPQSAVQALAQTPDGYLWIGTSTGLVRFDGSRFVRFGHADDKAFADDSVWSLTVTSDGTLWIGTEGGGLIRYRGGLFRAFAGAAGLTNLFVRAICERRDGSLWVGTDHGVFQASIHHGDDLQFRRMDSSGTIPSMSVYTIREGRDGALYVGGSGLLIIGPRGAHLFHPQTGSEDGFVGAVQMSRNGYLWVGTQAALRAIKPRTEGNSKKPFDPFDNENRVSIPSSLAPDTRNHIHVSVILEAGDGSLWIGTYGAGLLRFKDGSFRAFRTPEFLPDNHISSIFEDAQNDIWIGTPSGLTRLKHTETTSVRLAGGTPVDVNSISNQAAGAVLIAALEGKLLQPVGSLLSPASVPGLPAGLTVRTTFQDRGGAVWVGTAGQGLYSMMNGVATHHPPNFVRAFAESPKGVLWVGTDGPLWSNSSGQFVTLHGSAKTSYRALAFDHQGVLWAGSDSGLERISEGKILSEAALAPLDHVKVWSLLADRKGNVWIGSRGSGLYLWKNGTLKHYDPETGYPGESIFSILEDSRGQIWISSPEGVWSIDRDALVAAADNGSFGHSTHFYGDTASSVSTQISGGVQPSGVITPAGDLWFAATSGALHVQPTLSSSYKPYPLLIEQVREDGSRTSVTAPVRVPADVQQLEIDYTAVRLDAPDQTRFRYRLEGLEKRWTEAGTRRAAYYTHVPPNIYTFRVEAFDPGSPDRVISATIPIIFRPHFYQTVWFYTLCAVLLLVAIASIFILHRRRLQLGFKAVLEERNRLAREMHDTLIQGCIGVSALLEAAHNTEQSFPDKSRLLLERATIQNKNAIDEARHAVWNLRHDNGPVEFPFGSILTSLVAELREEGETPISLHMPELLPVLGMDVGESLLHVVREAMLNAIRHAGARQIQLRTRVARRILKIYVIDDGQGFATQSNDPLHYGITGMRERVLSLGGRFTLTTTEGKGTTVQIVLPFKRRVGRKREAMS